MRRTAADSDATRAGSWTRRAVIGGLAAASLGAAATPMGASAGPSPAESRWLLWYRRPASRWVEALPIGNGRLGAMVFGGMGRERLQLNEDTLWAGGPYDPSNPGALAALPQVQTLIRQGRYREAQALAERKMMAQPLRQMPYQTLGELVIESRSAEPCTGYRRWLDLDRAEAVAEWRDGGLSLRRAAFASADDDVIVVRIATEGHGEEALVEFSSPGAVVHDHTLWLEGTNLARQGIVGRVAFAAAVRAVGKDLRIRPVGSGLQVSCSGPLTLLIAARTSYRDWQRTDADPVAGVRADLDRAARHGGEELLARHLAAHRRLFRGFDIDLGRDPLPDVPTDERVRFSHERADDPHLAVLYLQYGRYLLISSSRPGAQPANLQGLWNASNDPPWGSKYTININTEMNYWPAEPTGLGECTEPLLRMVEELAESGARVAKVNYGARGWVAHHNTDLWRASAPIDAAFYGLWPCGGAWLCKHLWDRWDYSRDPAVLARIYPVLKGAGLFFLDTLVESADGSGLVTSPSLSPENAHQPDVSLCAGPAMDRQILRELFDNIVAAARLLGVDESLAREFEATRERLPADRIGEAGQLQEWMEDWDLTAPEIQHRHVSHLFAVHPGHAIGPETPELYAAARRSLEIRGDDATGWGIGWRINLWARLGESERAYTVLRKLLGPDRTYPNLFDAHPPFQIDGNFGGAAGIVEMLVRDRPQLLTLLPALPDAWPSGRVDGLCLRGGLRAHISWHGGRLDEARLTAARPLERDVEYAGRRQRLVWQAGETRTLRGEQPAAGEALRRQGADAGRSPA